MPEIANFKALPISAFSDPPGGGNDPFILASDDPAQLLTVSIDDDDATIEGDTITNETPNDANQIATVTDASGTLVSTDACYVEWTATYTGTNGQVIEVWRIELDNGLRLFAVSEIPEVGVTFTTSNKDQGADGLDPADIPDTPCFTYGVLIATTDGPRPIETLRVGDRVALEDGTESVIRWIGRRKYSLEEITAKPKLRPVRIVQGALGSGLPKRDMLISRQHRMLIQSKIAERMFGEPEVLVSAIRLTTLPGVFIDESVKEVEYFHLLFDRHEIIFAEGAPSESLFTGPEALKALGREAREEIQELFPEISSMNYEPVPARCIPTAKRQKQLVLRHQKNNRPCVGSPDTKAYR
ncbi:MAG: Hint domain-containing protein [Pseudomonadota bacterium]